MRCVAVIEAQRPGLDSVLIWESGGDLIAFAYLDGRVTMTRPLADTSTLDNAINEAVESFQIGSAQLTRVSDWSNTAVQAENVTTRNRW